RTRYTISVVRCVYQHICLAADRRSARAGLRPAAKRGHTAGSHIVAISHSIADPGARRGPRLAAARRAGRRARAAAPIRGPAVAGGGGAPRAIHPRTHTTRVPACARAGADLAGELYRDGARRAALSGGCVRQAVAAPGQRSALALQPE